MPSLATHRRRPEEEVNSPLATLATWLKLPPYALKRLRNNASFVPLSHLFQLSNATAWIPDAENALLINSARNTTSYRVPFPPRNNHHVMRIELEHWMAVGIMTPVVIVLYFVIVMVAYKTFCKRDHVIDCSSSFPSDAADVVETISSSSFDRAMTPPPTYAVAIGSGESLLVPPSYKMLFPPSCSSTSQDSLGDLPDYHSITCQEGYTSQESPDDHISASSDTINTCVCVRECRDANRPLASALYPTATAGASLGSSLSAVDIVTLCWQCGATSATTADNEQSHCPNTMYQKDYLRSHRRNSSF